MYSVLAFQEAEMFGDQSVVDVGDNRSLVEKSFWRRNVTVGVLAICWPYFPLSNSLISPFSRAEM